MLFLPAPPTPQPVDYSNWKVVLVSSQPQGPRQNIDDAIRRKNPWQDQLPQEHCNQVMRFLDPLSEVLPLSRVCTSWRRLVYQAKPIWKSVTFDERHILQEQDLLSFLKTYGKSMRSLAFRASINLSQDVLLRIISLTPSLRNLDITGLYGIPTGVFLDLFGQTQGQVAIIHDQVQNTFERLRKWVVRQKPNEEEQNPIPQQEQEQDLQEPMRFFQNNQDQQNPRELDADQWLGEKGFERFLLDLGLPATKEFVLDLFVRNSVEVNIKWASNITGLVTGSIVCIR
eukprot:TRINITY_DN8241_c0_g1_i2.p1 TRINITY_DN8241_c0_g1~~TRINITY_DN8241_c0_g1_i2.p1  ORF type:complete len:285 (-),score=46.25 TRINITY_DN8241_c0_g1_i2:803-1657(-)